MALYENYLWVGSPAVLKNTKLKSLHHTQKEHYIKYPHITHENMHKPLHAPVHKEMCEIVHLKECVLMTPMMMYPLRYCLFTDGLRKVNEHIEILLTSLHVLLLNQPLYLFLHHFLLWKELIFEHLYELSLQGSI